jgi:hypothetical protein
MKLKVKVNNKGVTFSILFAYATSLAPFMDASFRNYLVIGISALSFLLVAFKKFRFGVDLPLAMTVLLYMLITTLGYGTSRDLQSIAYFALFAMGYLALAAGLRHANVTVDSMEAFLKWLILLFAIVAVIQFCSSLAGFPVLNLLASRGLWNHNSLASEPSNVGRIVSLSMLVYLLLLRAQSVPRGLVHMIWTRKWVFLAYVVTVILSGSTLAIVAAPLALMLAFPTSWVLLFGVASFFAWPLLFHFDYEPLMRFIKFVAVAQTFNLEMMAATDNSATIRLAPVLIWLNELQDIGRWTYWFGSGLGSLNYFINRIPGLKDGVAVGFIPGYIMSFGVFGTALFLWTFLFRFLARRTLPVIALFVIFFITAGWNTQVFWFGLMLIRVTFVMTRASLFQRDAPATDQKTFLSGRVGPVLHK